MRILDRYILISFLGDLLVWGVLVVGLAILGDMALKFDEFLEDATLGIFLARMGTYAVAMVAMLLGSLVPILTLVAAMFTLTSMGRSGELVAMRASGLSPLRIALPIFVVAITISSGTFLLSEFLIPRHAEGILEALALGRGREEEKLRQLCIDGQGNVFFFERFAPRDRSFQRVWVDLRDPTTGRWESRLHASSGRWVGSREQARLRLEEGTFYPPPQAGSRTTRPVLFSTMELDTDLTPVDVEEPGARHQLESIAQLRERAARSRRQRPRILLQINSRISHYLFTSPVLLLIALPLALRVGSRGRWWGILVTVVVIGLFLAVHQSCISLGERGQIPPLVAAWFPVALAGSVGICMFANAQG